MWLSTRDGMSITDKSPVSIGKGTLKNDFDLHWHEFFEIEFITGGSGSCKINGTEYKLEKGVVCMMSTTDFHEIQINAGNPPQVIHVGIDPNVLDFSVVSRILALEGKACLRLKPAEYEKLYVLLQICIEESKKDAEEALKWKCMQDILEAVFILLLQKAEETEETPEPEIKSYVMRAITYLEMNFQNNPGLDEVAQAVSLNKNYFCSLFRKETGKSVICYLNDLKLEYARKMLLATELTANEIYLKCGFESISAFLHAFKKKYGTSPVKYRKDKKEKQKTQREQDKE